MFGQWIKNSPRSGDRCWFIKYLQLFGQHKMQKTTGFSIRKRLHNYENPANNWNKKWTWLKTITKRSISWTTRNHGQLWSIRFKWWLRPRGQTYERVPKGWNQNWLGGCRAETDPTGLLTTKRPWLIPMNGHEHPSLVINLNFFKTMIRSIYVNHLSHDQTVMNHHEQYYPTYLSCKPDSPRSAIISTMSHQPSMVA